MFLLGRKLGTIIIQGNFFHQALIIISHNRHALLTFEENLQTEGTLVLKQKTTIATPIAAIVKLEIIIQDQNQTKLVF